MLDIEIRKHLEGFTLDVSFSVGNGLAAIFGPSGSGKSLTLQCIAGLHEPDEGKISVNGSTVFDSVRRVDLRPQERNIGYVFQNYALFPHMTVMQNVAYGLHRLSSEERGHRLEKAVSSMRLKGLENRWPAELSGGQQQRAAVARALVTQPRLLLLDEPFSALDSPIRSRLHGELLPLLRGLAITTVLVTHDLAEAYTLSETMVVLDSGRVLQVAPRDEVLRRPANRSVARFTGAKNLLRGVVTGVRDHSLEVRAAKLLLEVPLGSHRIGEEVDLCVRPEEIMLIRQGRDASAAVRENRFSGEIVGEIGHGTSFTLLFKLLGDPLGNRRDYDFHIDLPANVYEKLGVSAKKEWEVSLKREAIHLMGIA